MKTSAALALDTQQHAAQAHIQFALPLAFVMHLQKAHVVLGVSGVLVLQATQEPVQEFVPLATLA
jgi:hypothetical protein